MPGSKTTHYCMPSLSRSRIAALRPSWHSPGCCEACSMANETRYYFLAATGSVGCRVPYRCGITAANTVQFVMQLNCSKKQVGNTASGFLRLRQSAKGGVDAKHYLSLYSFCAAERQNGASLEMKCIVLATSTPQLQPTTPHLYCTLRDCTSDAKTSVIYVRGAHRLRWKMLTPRVLGQLLSMTRRNSS